MAFFACWIFAVAFATISANAVSAEPTLVAAIGDGSSETIVVQVTLNHEKKGEFFIKVLNGEFLILTKDLKTMGVVGARGRLWQSGDEEYIWVNSIAGVAARFDEARMSLDLTADAKLLPSTTVELWTGRREDVLYSDNASAFFNYEIGYAGGNGGVRDGVTAATQFGGRVGNFLLLSDTTCDSLRGSARCVRLATSLIHDRRDTLVRTIVGDFGIAPGWLGTAFSMGGLSYSKVYDIDPYLIRYPQQSLAGQLLTPSQVDVYIDGRRVQTLRLPAGDFDLRNVTQTTGFRSVDLVIRDAFGREQRTSTSYYSSERSLKAGLHEYSYNLGALRENFGVESNEYGPLAFAGFHRYGVTDALTIGIRAEGKSGRVSAGPSAAIVLGSAGLLNLAASFSDDHGNAGAAVLANYSYQGQHFSAGLLARKDSRHYAALLDFGLGRRNYEAAANVGYASPAVGSFSLGAFTYRAYEGKDRKAFSMSYGRAILGGRASFFVTVVNEWAEVRRTDVFAGFTYNFDADYALIGHHERRHGSTRETLQFQKAQPVGEGLGYVLGISRISNSDYATTQFMPSFQYKGHWGTLRGYAQQTDGPESPRSYSLSFAGGVAWAGGILAFGRPVTDSFGVVKVDELEGVRILVNNEPIGETGPDGRLFVPSLSSFIDNQISIDVNSVPLEFTFPESVRVVSPAYRAGATVDFHAKRLQAYGGKLKIKENGQVCAAEFFDVTIDVGGKPLTFVTGRGGEYYIEDLKEGRYRGRAAFNGTRCAFELVVLPTQGVLTDLGETTCE